MFVWYRFSFLRNCWSRWINTAVKIEGQTGSMVVRRAFWKGVHLIFIKVGVLSVKKHFFAATVFCFVLLTNVIFFYGKSKLANVFPFFLGPRRSKTDHPCCLWKRKPRRRGGALYWKAIRRRRRRRKKYYSSRFPVQEEGEKEVSILHKVQDWKVLLKQKEKIETFHFSFFLFPRLSLHALKRIDGRVSFPLFPRFLYFFSPENLEGKTGEC